MDGAGIVALLWRAVFALDRAWLAVPGLRPLASQFAIAGRSGNPVDVATRSSAAKTPER